ncbi:hypothetical protein NLG97_g357 [Lecanicillium saksenae]|uniref:Uncharacterized protein n=1 Tax=Lecanicillium saksenae TaxID=468837 RepID=A0ACC1R6S8_9HYPO|nr:hypothetical protein NLG97_g357 [Lecanicillium saksenae]
MRKAKTKSPHYEKHCSAGKLTIQELRCLLQPYKDDDNADVILSDEGNQQTLRRWYRSLSTNFARKRGRKLAVINATAIKSIERSQLQLNDSTLDRFRLWSENPQAFWSPTADEWHLKQRPCNSPGTYRKFFTVSAINLYKEYSACKTLWRFTTAALYLHFRRWKPEIQSIRTAHIQDFSRFMGCEASDDETAALLAVTKAGQRRISFCQLLATRVTAQSRLSDRPHDEDATRNAANEDDYYRRALGILFYENIPDSIFDTDQGLFQKDQDAIIRHLHSIQITSPPTQYDTCHLANKLLDYQNALVWPDENDHCVGQIFTRNGIILEQGQRQITPMEAAGMLESLAASQSSNTCHHASQMQPTHASARTQPSTPLVSDSQGIASNPADNLAFPAREDAFNARVLPTTNSTPRGETVRFNRTPFAGIMPPVRCQTGVPVNPDSLIGLPPQNVYQSSYQTGISTNSSSSTGLIPPDDYQPSHQAGVCLDPRSFIGLISTDDYQPDYHAGVYIDPNSFIGLMSTDACQTGYQTGASVDPNSFTGLMPREMYHSSEAFANDSGGNLESERLSNVCHANLHQQQFARLVPPGGGRG